MGANSAGLLGSIERFSIFINVVLQPTAVLLSFISCLLGT